MKTIHSKELWHDIYPLDIDSQDFNFKCMEFTEKTYNFMVWVDEFFFKSSGPNWLYHKDSGTWFYMASKKDISNFDFGQNLFCVKNVPLVYDIICFYFIFIPWFFWFMFSFFDGILVLIDPFKPIHEEWYFFFRIFILNSLDFLKNSFQVFGYSTGYSINHKYTVAQDWNDMIYNAGDTFIFGVRFDPLYEYNRAYQFFLETKRYWFIYPFYNIFYLFKELIFCTTTTVKMQIFSIINSLYY